MPLARPQKRRHLERDAHLLADPVERATREAAAAEPVEESTEEPVDDEVETSQESEADGNEELSSDEVTDGIEEEALGVDGGEEEG